MGDWIRDGSTDPGTLPLWLRGPMHRPVALGLSVARTLLAFERVFADSDAQNWRTALAILRRPEAPADLNNPGAALMMNSHLLNVLNFSYPKAENRTFQTCRKLTPETLQTAGRGGQGTLLSQAAHTPPDTMDGLQHVPKPQRLRTGKPHRAIQRPSPVKWAPAEHRNSSTWSIAEGRCTEPPRRPPKAKPISSSTGNSRPGVWFSTCGACPSINQRKQRPVQLRVCRHQGPTRGSIEERSIRFGDHRGRSSQLQRRYQYAVGICRALSPIILHCR